MRCKVVFGFRLTIQNTTNRHVSNAFDLLAVFISFPWRAGTESMAIRPRIAWFLLFFLEFASNSFQLRSLASISCAHFSRFCAAAACCRLLLKTPARGASTAPPPASVAAYCSRAAPPSVADDGPSDAVTPRSGGCPLCSVFVTWYVQKIVDSRSICMVGVCG